MKRLILWLGLLCITLPSFGAEWLLDVPTAQAKAKRENKFVLLDFTGSDWCGWCIKLKTEVFDQPAFAAFADANLVLVELDFPRRKAQSPTLIRDNQKLAETYGIRGFPSVLILNPDGKLMKQTGYVAGGADNYVEHLKQIMSIKSANGPVAKKQTGSTEPEVRRAPPAFVPVAPAIPTQYSELALKGISGAKDRRMALINNQTFMAGETAKVKVKDGRVEVLCKEIRDDSVSLTVDGKPTVLKLKTN